MAKETSEFDLCECEHERSEHADDTGQCSAVNGPHTVCSCPAFVLSEES